MKIYMIRHGKTKGNTEKRYVGSTDEWLLPEERERLQQLPVPEIDCLYVSPMKRCRETADILFPHMQQIVIEDFRECDFGMFEYKNYIELSGKEEYQRFIDTNGKSGFPGGESRQEFQDRCCEAFENMIKREQRERIGMVVHGGTIMALLDRYSNPHKDYYEWQIGNGEGLVMQVEKGGEK